MDNREYFRVLRNDAGDLGVWPLDGAVPAGWQAVGFHGTRGRCLAYAAALPPRPAAGDRRAAGIWAGTVGRYGDRTAVTEERAGSWTYRRLDEIASDVAARLTGLGARRGDRVVVGGTGRAALAALLGAVKAGTGPVPAPVDPAVADARWVIGDDLLVRATGVAPEPSPAPAVVFHDPSGSAVVWSADALFRAPGPAVAPGDVVRLDSGAPLHQLAWGLLRQGALVSLPAAAPAPDPENDKGWWRAVLELGPGRSTVVGLPETAAVAVRTGSAEDGYRLDPLPERRLHVLDPGLRAVADGAEGRFWIGGPALAAGYLGRPMDTADRLLPDPFGAPGDRMFDTGESARRSGERMVLIAP